MANDMKLKLRLADNQTCLGLHTEDGKLLPNQSDVKINTPIGGLATVTVTFLIDGDTVDLMPANAGR